MANPTDVQNLGQTTQGQPVTVHMQFQKEDLVNGDPHNDYLVNADPQIAGIVYLDDNGQSTRHIYPDVVVRDNVGLYHCTITPTVAGDLRGANYSQNFDSRQQWVLRVLADPTYP